jgi:hypothetical protein
MYEGQVYVVTVAPPTGTPGAADAVGYTALGGGGTVPEPEPVQEPITVNSGATSLTVAAGGAASVVAYIGNGGALLGVTLLGAQITLPLVGDTYSTALTAAGTVDTFDATFETGLAATVSASPITVHAQLYYAAPGSEVYDAIAGSEIILDPPVETLSIATTMTGTLAGIGFPVEAGGRILVVYSTVSGELTILGTLLGTATATVTFI